MRVRAIRNALPFIFSRQSWHIIQKKRSRLHSALLLMLGLLAGSFVFGQAPLINVKGTVTDSAGGRLSGATITENTTKASTSSNSSGEFTLNGIKKNATLSISMVGYKTVQVRATENVSIQLLTSATSLDEVIVTGYQSIAKQKFTGASVTLRAEDVKLDGVVDVSRMLEGRAAGVSVQTVSSTFGSAPILRIRGATSINGDNKPLWVVDGVVLEDLVNISNDQLSSGDPATLLGSSVAGINVNDIETFDILKDASATALYGARAMNGVVVISTKKGKAGTPKVSYTGNFSSQFKPVYGDYNIMNSAQQMSVFAELERKGSLNTDILNSGNYAVYGKYYNMVNDTLNGGFAIANTPEAKRAYLLRYAKANTDWFDVLFRQSLIQEHSLSLSSGNDRSQSFFSTSFYTDNGWTVADNVKRVTLNFRNNYKFSDRLSAGFLTTGSYRAQHAPGTVQRAANVVTGGFTRDFDINPFSYSLNTNRAITAYQDNGEREYFTRNFAPFNILTELENNRLNINVIDLKLQGDLSYKLARDLKYTFVGAFRYVRSTREHEVTENANMANAYRAAGNATIRQNNPFLYQDPEKPASEKVVVLPFGGFYNRIEDQLVSYDIRNNLEYSTIIKEKHNVSVLAGQQIKFSNRQNASSNGYGYQYDNGGVASPDYRILKQTIENNFPYFGMYKNFDRFAAFYINGQYTYNQKYNFSGTARYDGSNQLGSSKTARWLPTWTLAAAWNIDQENFMKNVKFVDFLKLRGSYGLTASLGPATNSNIELRNINIHRPYLTDIETIIQIANLANNDLTWEKNYASNIGLDGSLFGNRLNFSLDAYSRRSFDLISVLRTSGIGGQSDKAANNSDLTSRGIEVMVGGQVYKSKNISWRTNLTFGYNTTEITRTRAIPRIFDLIKAEGGNLQGYPVNSLFSIKFKGLNPATGIPEFTSDDGKTSSGVYMQSDSTQYLKYEGSVAPKFTGGFNNTISYKAFTLNIFFTYQAGNKIRLYPAFADNYSEWNATPKEFYDRWVKPGDQTTTNVPSIMDALYAARQSGTGNYPYINYNYSTERIAKGDFVRLKTVSLGYQLPEKLLVKTGFLKNMSIMLAAINPWLIYSDKKLEGQDPEFFNSGGVAQPIQRQITFTLRAGL